MSDQRHIPPHPSNELLQVLFQKCITSPLEKGSLLNAWPHPRIFSELGKGLERTISYQSRKMREIAHNDSMYETKLTCLDINLLNYQERCYPCPTNPVLSGGNSSIMGKEIQRSHFLSFPRMNLILPTLIASFWKEHSKCTSSL